MTRTCARFRAEPCGRTSPRLFAKYTATFLAELALLREPRALAPQPLEFLLGRLDNAGRPRGGSPGSNRRCALAGNLAGGGIEAKLRTDDARIFGKAVVRAPTRVARRELTLPYLRPSADLRCPTSSPASRPARLPIASHAPVASSAKSQCGVKRSGSFLDGRLRTPRNTPGRRAGRDH
jgi:hypothetical protein